MSGKHRTADQPRLTGMQVRILFAIVFIGALAASPLLPGGAA